MTVRSSFFRQLLRHSHIFAAGDVISARCARAAVNQKRHARVIADNISTMLLARGVRVPARGSVPVSSACAEQKDEDKDSDRCRIHSDSDVVLPASVDVDSGFAYGPVTSFGPWDGVTVVPWLEWSVGGVTAGLVKTQLMLRR